MLKRVGIKVSAEEHTELLAAAKLQSMALATFIRVMVLRVVRGGE